MDPMDVEDAPSEEKPTPANIEDASKPTSEDDDSLPAHRVVARAVVTSIVAAPVMCAAISAGWFAVVGYQQDLVFNFLMMSGAFCLLLGLCAGAARSVRRAFRPLVLLVAGVFSALIAGMGLVWARGLLDGGPQAAWSAVERLLRKLLGGGYPSGAIGVSTLIAFMAVGLVHSRALPRILRRYSDRLWFHLIAGLVGGGLGTVAFTLLRQTWFYEAAALWLGGALGCAAGLWLGERLDAVIQRWLKARRETS